MRRIAFIIGITLLLPGCGSSGIADLVGPILDRDEVTELRIDQLGIGAIPSDEFGLPRFAVYLRDGTSKAVIACAGYEDGTNVVRDLGVYYGGLDIPLKLLKEIDAYQGLQFELVVVEKDGNDCPAGITADDDIVGATGALDFNGLLNTPLTTTNGQARLMLKAQGAEANGVPLMSASLRADLGVEYLGIGDDIGDGETPGYSLVLVGTDGDGFGCQIAADRFPAIRRGATIYGGLELFFPCAGLSDIGELARKVQVQLWRQTDDAPEQVTQTSFLTLRELIGQTIDFQDDRSSIRFRDWNAAPFGRPKVSQEEIALLHIAAATFAKGPAAGGVMEIHLLDGGVGYSVACAGPGNGLPEVTGPGTIEGLSTPFLPASGQGELFGWASLRLVAIERAEGAACPAPATPEDTVLAQTVPIQPADLSGGTFTLTQADGKTAGSITLQTK